jgi:hypothetical protein
MKPLKLIAIFAVVCISFSCKNSDDESNIDMSKIDFSNIEDLYTQPLPVIQKCVEGKWKWYRTYQSGFIGINYPINTFVTITKDSVIITGASGSGYSPTLSYDWIKKHTYSGEYVTCVMNFNSQNIGEGAGWYFDSIKNDSLYVGVDYVNTSFYADYLFVRIK